MNVLTLESVYYKKSKCVPNLTSMALTGMPTGKGRKGSEPPRKRKKKEEVESHVPLSVPEPSAKDTSASPQVVISNSSLQGVSASVTCTVTKDQHPSYMPSWPTVSQQHQFYSSQHRFPSPVGTPPALGTFHLCFITGNISVCAGCGQRYHKPVVSPFDLVVRHEERRTFSSPVSSARQSRFDI